MRDIRARRFMAARAFGCLLLAGVTAPAFAQTLEPAGEWTIRDYEDKCRASRAFGEGEDRVSLWIDKASAGNFVNITLIGRPFRDPYGARTKIAFSPGEPLNRGFVQNVSSKGRPVLTMFGVAPVSLAENIATDETATPGEETVDLAATSAPTKASAPIISARLDAIEAIEVSGAVMTKVSLKTGSLLAMMEGLQECADTLSDSRLKTPSGDNHKGQGPRDRDTIKWAPMIQANYPSYLLREGAQGSVGVRVQINPQGRATFCEVIEHTGPAGLNDAACLGMLRYSRFDPAKDKDGTPIWGIYQTKVTYRLN